MTGKKYQYIDLTYMYEIADDDLAFVREMLASFIEKIPPQFEQLLNSAVVSDYKQTSFLAHKLKASYQLMGVKLLADMAYRIEVDSAENPEPAILELVQSMKPLVDLAIGELQTELALIPLKPSSDL
ncbi:MAG: Hpt domain-containing protein [Bacteroidia bacterium]|jgi:HPt (histidine-containing phosphotransfer) domain-containing protein